MKANLLKEYLNEAPENDIWTVTLKRGERVVCRANPKKTQMEVAYNQFDFERGDIILPREIQDMDNQ